MGAKASRENRISLEWLQEQVRNQQEQVVYLRNIQTYFVQNEERIEEELEEDLKNLEDEFAALSTKYILRQQIIEAMSCNPLSKDLERMRKKLGEEIGEIRTFVVTLPTKVKCKYNPMKKNMTNDLIQIKDAAEKSTTAQKVLISQSEKRERRLRVMDKTFKAIMKKDEISAPCNCSHKYLCRYANSEVALDRNNNARMSNGSIYSITIMSSPADFKDGGSSCGGWRGKIRKLFRVKEKV